jgi:Fe-S cluster biosynthesis and repair protein YggX
MSYVPVISAVIIVHMEAEQVSKKTIDLYIDQTKFWINELTINMEEEGMRNLLKQKQKKYIGNKK